MFKSLKNTQRAFTMTEVVIAAVIFALAAVGIAAMASNLRQPAQESAYDVTAMMIGKGIIANLRRTYSYSNGLGGNPHILSNITINSVTYMPYYNVYSDPQSNTRKFVVSVNWI